jgi:hypothetical protein
MPAQGFGGCWVLGSLLSLLALLQLLLIGLEDLL